MTNISISLVTSTRLILLRNPNKAGKSLLAWKRTALLYLSVIQRTLCSSAQEHDIRWNWMGPQAHSQ